MRGPNGYPVRQAQCIFFREETTGSTDGTSNNGVKLKLYKKCQLNQKKPKTPKHVIIGMNFFNTANFIHKNF